MTTFLFGAFCGAVVVGVAWWVSHRGASSAIADVKSTAADAVKKVV